MNKILLRLFVLFCCASLNAQISVPFNFQTFADSFLRHYEFNPEGRYTHEYHPFLLTKTAHSFDELEEKLRHDGFNLCGRIVISGYEEHAVPSYYTNFKSPRINDEASVKGNAGWSLKLHNRFGFMTGFLFKDINATQKPGVPTIFEHVDVDTIPIFDHRAIIFQEHAFGQALKLMEKAHESVMKRAETGDTKKILEDLVKFWEIMYYDALQIGNKQVAGTQDILFSIDYARYLIRSKLPLIKYYVGPDITYPIEVSSKQEKGATLHAQAFVRRFTQQLQPIGDKNTVYIFCSFVDGVGKSTTLGNIKNWMKYGDAIEKFDHVDNSSSQLAEIFQFKDKVFIADLPAQVSHFTYKPDGLVFVDARTEYPKDKLTTFTAHVKERRKELKESFDQLLREVKSSIARNGYFAQEIWDKTKPFHGFARNVILLKKEKTNQWIPFEYEGKPYLFHYQRPQELRCMTTLSKVKSDGLKTIESEQMLFFDGIRFPLPFASFAQYLIDHFAKNQIENVVLVDFTSMYPRSSRENIRINYLIQQMALLSEKFDVAQSLYKNFVSGGELLYTMVNKTIRDNMFANLELETSMRALLCKLIVERQQGDITGLTIPTVTEALQESFAQLTPQDINFVRDLVHKKVTVESKNLERIYGKSKQFVNVQQFSLTRACILSTQLQEFFVKNIDNEVLLSLWGDYGDLCGPDKEIPDGRCNLKMGTTTGMLLGACYKLQPTCKDEQLLTPLIRVLRACWYAGLANIINGVRNADKKLAVPAEKYHVAPAFLKRGIDDNMYLVQDKYEPWQKEVKRAFLSVYNPFNLIYHSAECFGDWGGTPYRLDWQSFGTNADIYAYHCNLDQNNRATEDISAVTLFVQKHQNDYGASTIISTSELLEKFKDSLYWKFEWQDFTDDAKKNGLSPKQKENAAGQKENNVLGAGERKMYKARPDQRNAAQTLAILYATIDMVMKDPDSDVVIRYGNRDDFKAALKLFEKVTLPRSFGLVFNEDLFSNYDAVEPYPSWDFWDELAE